MMLDKRSVELLCTEDGRYHLRFRCNSKVRCFITVMFFCLDTIGANRLTEIVCHEHYRSSSHLLEPGENFVYEQPPEAAVDTSSLGDYIYYKENSPQYPIVVLMERAEYCSEQVNKLFTYMTFTKPERPGQGLGVRVLKQRIEHGDRCFDLKEVFGISSHPAEGDAAGGSQGNADILSQTATNTVEESNECVICLTSAPEVTIIPCGHHCMCAECAAYVRESSQSEKCPICRGPILRLLHIPSTGDIPGGSGAQ